MKYTKLIKHVEKALMDFRASSQDDDGLELSDDECLAQKAQKDGIGVRIECSLKKLVRIFLLQDDI